MPPFGMGEPNLQMLYLLRRLMRQQGQQAPDPWAQFFQGWVQPGQQPQVTPWGQPMQPWAFGEVR